MNGYSMKGFFYLFCIIAWLLLTVYIREEFDPIIPTGLSIFGWVLQNITIGKVLVIISTLIVGLFFGLTEFLVAIFIIMLPIGVFLWLFWGMQAWIASAVGAGLIVIIVGGFIDFLWDSIRRKIDDDW